MSPEQSLLHAVHTCTSRPPLTTEYPDLTLDIAYEIQDRVVQARVASGNPVIGAKLGLTSRAKQAQMGVAEPLYGWLTADMVREGVLDTSDFIQPRVEPEIGFRIGRDVSGAEVTAEDVLTATVEVFPAIDVLDSRFTGYTFTMIDVVADNASAAALARAPGIAPSPPLDLALTGCVLTINDQVVATAAGAAVLGHPAASVAWLVRQLAKRGRGLAAGSIVLSGALTEAFPVQPGDHVVAEFDHLGSVALQIRDSGSDVD
jgi:2-oxo-3-hexenedioate decarboxylase